MTFYEYSNDSNHKKCPAILNEYFWRRDLARQLNIHNGFNSGQRRLPSNMIHDFGIEG